MKTNRLIPITILLAMILLSSACQPKPTPAAPTVSPLTGTLSELQGKVDSKKTSEIQFTPVTIGTVLAVNDQVQTGEDGRVRIDLSSGTIVRVVPSSLFTLASNEETSSGLATKGKLDLGRLFIILTGGSLEVETPSGVASVLGSYMMVSVDPQNLDTTVTCLEGQCQAGNAVGTIHFTDGQKTILSHANPAAPKVEEMSDEDYRDWKNFNPDANKMVTTIQGKNQKPPTATPTLITIVPATATPTASLVCFKIIEPPNDASLPFNGPVNFQWETQSGAAQYSVTFHFPSARSETFITTSTDLTRYMDTLLDGGAYQWDVTALDGSGNAICTTPGSSFNKPSSNPVDVAVPTKVPDEAPRCKPSDAQWNDPSAPCYCDPNSSDNGSLPGYCQGPGLPN